MNISVLGQWAALFALLLSIGNIVWAWISRPARDLGSRIDSLDTETTANFADMRGNLKDHDRRIQKVEDDMHHLPTKDDLHAVVVEMREFQTELKGMNRVVHRLEEYLRSERA